MDHDKFTIIGILCMLYFFGIGIPYGVISSGTLAESNFFEITLVFTVWIILGIIIPITGIIEVLGINKKLLGDLKP